MAPWPLLLGLAASLCLRLGSAFDIVWAVPSKKCLHLNLSLPLSDYGIQANADETLIGSRLVLFYERDLGFYPFIDKKGNWINGGIPQAVNLTAHLRAVAETVQSRIPDANFSGLGVIDWEAWRPVWNANYASMRIYQKASLEEARKRWPHASVRDLKTKARRRFNKAAKRLMTETLQLVKSLRPAAKWGFYGFPMCFHQDAKTRSCSANSQKYNARWSWLFKLSTAIYPSVYLLNKHLKEKWSQTQKLLYIQIWMKEALRWAAMAAEAEPKPVHAFTKFTYDAYHDSGLLYSKADLCASIKQVADMGGAGVLLWSSYFSVRSEATCRRSFDYVRDLLGPYALIVRSQQRECGRSRCSGRGRCRLPPPLPLVCSSLSPFKAYRCVCEEGWAGQSCEHRSLSAFWRLHAFKDH